MSGDKAGDWECEHENLMEDLARSQEIVTKAITAAKSAGNVRDINQIRSHQIPTEDIIRIQQLTDKLQTTLNSIYAIDSTMYTMLKMIKVSGMLISYCQKPVAENVFIELESAVKAMQLYLVSAYKFVQSLYGDLV